MPDKFDSDRSGGVCTAVTGSMTNALKAQKTLAVAAIPSSVKKVSSQGGRGCVYGVNYSCAQARNVRVVLENANINVKQYIE